MKAEHSASIKTPAASQATFRTLVNPFSITIEARMPSEIRAISPLVDQLMRPIKESRCIAGKEFAVELALREALSNAVIHGNAMDPHKFVEVRYRCEWGRGVWLEVRDGGKGFDPNSVPDPLTPDGLVAEHGRGIHLMKSVMDQVSFEAGGTVVRMWKGLARKARPTPRIGQAQPSASHELKRKPGHTAFRGW